MQRVKFKKPDGSWGHVCATAFNPEAFAGIPLLCDDRDCMSGMFFRAARDDSGIPQPIHDLGRSKTRKPHFTTRPKQAHRDGCTAWHAPDDDHTSGDRPTWQEAARQGQKIVINLNDDLGSGLHVNIRDMRDIKGGDTPYGRFMRDNGHDYATYAVQGGIAGLRAALREIKAVGGATALDRVYVSHHLGIIPYRAMLVGADTEKLKDLYKDLCAKRDVLAVHPDKVIGLPRLLHFIPSQKTLDANDPPHFAGRSIIADTKTGVEQGKEQTLLLLNELVPRDHVARTALLHQREATILACPVVRPYLAQVEMARYRKGDVGTAFLKIEWMIVSAAQIAPPARRMTRVSAPIPTEAQKTLGF